MDHKIKSYKLSPQLRAELNFSQKRNSSNFSFSQTSFRPNLSHLPWRAISIVVSVCVLVITGYVGVKKGYEFTAQKNESKRIAQLQNYEQKLQGMKNEVATQASDAYTFVTLSQQYLKNKDVEKAEIAANLAVEKDQNWRDAYLNQGQIKLSVNKFDEAKTAFDNALKIDPLSGQAHYLLSLTYQELKDNDAAKIEFAKAKQFGFETEIGG